MPKHTFQNGFFIYFRQLREAAFRQTQTQLTFTAPTGKFFKASIRKNAFKSQKEKIKIRTCMKMQNKFKASGNFTDKKSQFNQSRRKLMIF